MKTLPGSISISRPGGSEKCDYISIRFTEEGSRIQFLEARVKYADFAQAITGLVSDCELVLCELNLVGQKREHKTEQVFVPDCPYDEREEVAAQAVAAYEVDGWTGRVEDALNHHKRNNSTASEKGALYRVVFVRWVKSEKGRGE